MKCVTIFFDFDGPIVDNRFKYHALHRDVLAELGCGSHCEREAYWRAKRERTSEWEILRGLGAEHLFVEYERRRTDRIEDAHYARLDRAWPGIVEHLAKLGEKFELTLLSLRKRRSELLTEIAELGLGTSFSRVLSKEDNAGTPNVKVQLARSSTHGRERHCCFVGDTELDINAGKELGIATIAVCSGIRSDAELRATMPDLVVKSALDVSEPLVTALLDHKWAESRSSFRHASVNPLTRGGSTLLSSDK